MNNSVQDSPSARYYQPKYEKDLDVEVRMFRLGASPKADSVEMLTRDLAKPFGSLADIGCGPGAVLEELVRRGLARQYFAVDSSPHALAHVKQTLGDKVTPVQADLEKDSLSVRLDLAVVCHVLEHLSDPSALLRAMTTKCSYLVAEVPLENQPVTFVLSNLRCRLRGKQRTDNTSGHLQFFTRSSFRKLLKSSGWEILKERRYLPHLLPYCRELAYAEHERHGRPLWRGLLPHYVYRCLGSPISERIASAHYAVLARPTNPVNTVSTKEA